MWRHVVQETADFTPCTEEGCTCSFTVISESSLLLTVILKEPQEKLKGNQSYRRQFGGTDSKVVWGHNGNVCIPNALWPRESLSLSRPWPLGWQLGLSQLLANFSHFGTGEKQLEPNLALHSGLCQHCQQHVQSSVCFPHLSQFQDFSQQQLLWKKR